MENTSNNLRNIALLIDADNIQSKMIDSVLTVMAELGQVNIRRAYGNFAKGNLAKWADVTNKFAIRPQQQFDVAKGKNATDMAMTIDAIDLLYQGKVDGFGIMSSDSDFTPLVTRLRQDGLVVYGFGSSKTPISFREACTRFIEIEQLVKLNTKAEPDVIGSTNTAEKDEELHELILAAIQEAKPNDDGFARVGRVGQIMGNRSSFDVRNYGFKNLLALLTSLRHFEVKRDENDHPWVRRR